MGVNNNRSAKGEIPMSARKRILAIQLAEKIQQNPEYAKKIGVSVEVKHRQIQKKKKVNYNPIIQ